MAIATKDLAVDCLARAKALAAAASTPLAAVHDDMLRSALVMGVAAVDTLMHTIVFRSVLNNAATLTSKIDEKLTVGFGEVARMTDAAKRAQKSGKRWKPWVHAKRVLHQRLLTETMQSPRGIEDAMAMAGIKKGWSRVGTEMGEPVEDIKVRLGAIVYRRNEIAHEGDYLRFVRPQRVRLRTIDAAAVSSDLDWLGRLIDALAVVAATPVP